jgi:sulfane dehydrogenase subunit SoxC
MTTPPPPVAPDGTTDAPSVSYEELQLATRNHGMPLEALRYDVTPVGLHYLLIHYDIPHLDPDAWRLRIHGQVEQPTELALADLRARGSVTRRVTMECAGNGRATLRPRALSQPWLLEAVGTGEWTGVLVADLLEAAGVRTGAVEAVFTGADRGVEGGTEQSYARSLTLQELRTTGALLAWALNGAPLPPQHGAPVRLVVPGWYGMTSVKWVTSIELVDVPFTGYQQTRAYRLCQAVEEGGRPLNRLAVRALMSPPGIPDFYTRRRLVDRGTHTVHGRAWSGHGTITAVELSSDGGRTWSAAELAPADDPAAWTGWRATWDADTPGEVELCCRATDGAGNTQPDEAAWNLGGYAANAPHRVPVTVR